MIVVIDQDPVSAAYLADQLNPDRSEVVHVVSARDGFQGVKQQVPAAVLICAEVPNGIATCNKMKRDAKLKDIPVVLMSEAWDGKVLALHRSLPTRADFYADKPLDDSLLTLPVFQKLRRGNQPANQAQPSPPAPPKLKGDEGTPPTTGGPRRRPTGADVPTLGGQRRPTGEHRFAGRPPARPGTPSEGTPVTRVQGRPPSQPRGGQGATDAPQGGAGGKEAQEEVRELKRMIAQKDRDLGLLKARVEKMSEGNRAVADELQVLREARQNASKRLAEREAKLKAFESQASGAEELEDKLREAEQIANSSRDEIESLKERNEAATKLGQELLERAVTAEKALAAGGGGGGEGGAVDTSA
ncbi:MAG: hypothetical protein QF464_09250, partial [Myxococcota bacterium]|nr:hypothetical protein [Myxococcota bacterium]